jgi:aryl-alcohol dehydrogenase-like predicted oxidoreductase
VLGELGVGCIAFSPLAQGMLTGKYLDGIPEGSRAARDSSFESAATRARRFQGHDEEGYRAEFIDLVERAANLRRGEQWRESRR